MTHAFSRLTIDLGAVAANYKLFQDKVGTSCAVAGVVKANAYGLGVDRVVPLLDQLGCPFYFVATFEEALQVRTLTQKLIAVLGGLVAGAEAEYLAHDILPVFNTAEAIQQSTYKGKSIWHIDTGMNRLGLDADQASTLAAQPQPFMIMSHFACADEEGHALTTHQAKRFADVAKAFPNSQRSLCNSSGLFRDAAWHYDMVRPGMALYGLNPTPEIANPMRQTVTLEAKLLQVRNGRAGETVGYGATHTLTRDTRIGIVGLGYADGFLRAGSSKATLYVQGHPCPVLGRISMDLTAIDLNACEASIQEGDWVEILGSNQSPDELAKASGTIGYEILTSLGDRHQRIYIPA